MNSKTSEVKRSDIGPISIATVADDDGRFTATAYRAKYPFELVGWVRSNTIESAEEGARAVALAKLRENHYRAKEEFYALRDALKSE